MHQFRIASVISALALAAASQAALSFVSDRSQLNQDDSITWDTFGPEFTVVPSGSLGSTASGDPFVVFTTNGTNTEVRQQGTSWAGNFAPGDYVLWNQISQDDIYLRFSESYAAVAFQIQTDEFGSFDGEIEAYDLLGFSLGSFGFSGNSTSDGDNSAITVGLRSSLQDIGYIRVGARSMELGNDFGINQVTLEQCNPVPEPASMAALGFGALALLRRRKKA